MAEFDWDVHKIIATFREIVKRKTTYNETNLHYEYFKRVGDTIPYKAHGFESLRDFIQKYAGDVFYFERVGTDMEFIAPKRAESNGTAPMEVVNSDGSKPIGDYSVKKIVPKNGNDSSKKRLLSDNMHFGLPQSTGLCNPFQSIQNDIKISFNFESQKREVDQYSVSHDTSESSPNDKQSARSDKSRKNDEQMDIDEDAVELPWDDKYWHLKITHAVSSNEIWARFFDKFEVNYD